MCLCSGFEGGTAIGAGGGGALEIGAVGNITISGQISANGGASGINGGNSGGPGGGAGGGILIHGDSVTISGFLQADGSTGGFSTSGPGGGGGGRVTILYSDGGAPLNNRIQVSGGGGGGSQFGTGGANGGVGVIQIEQVVPEPSSLVLTCSGLVGLLAFGLRRRRVA